MSSETPTSTPTINNYFDQLERPQHPLCQYFPAAMHSELDQAYRRFLDGNSESFMVPTKETFATSSTGLASIPDLNLDGPASPPAMEFDTIHRIRTLGSPGRTGPSKFGKLIVGTQKPLDEANDRAMKEVYEFHHARAHADGNFLTPPNPDWIRKAGTEAAWWPMTWKVENGQLRFSLTIDKGHYKVLEEILVVKSGSPCIDEANVDSGMLEYLDPMAGRKRKRDTKMAV